MMKRTAFLFLFAAGLFAGTALGNPAARADLKDEEIVKQLIGKWEEALDEDGIKGTMKLEYKKDNTFAAEGTLEINGQNIKVTASGPWKVSGGELTTTIEKVTPEGLVPPNTVSKDKILSIDEKTCTYRDEKGKERKMTRLKD